MNALRIVDLPDGTPPLALELPPATTFEQWVTIGRSLCLGQQALNWHIGDWWAFGDHRYGDRAKAAAEGIFGLSFKTLSIYGSVCRQFESSRRLEHLTFAHHQEVAALPVDQADELLEKAEREHLSTRDLRREVQALKAANDPDEASSTKPEEVKSKAIPGQTVQAELTKVYEMVIELADALKELRPLTRREDSIRLTALSFVEEAHSGHRECPADFDVIFVEKGRLECETWYRAARATVNRWLVERGKARLLRARADYVDHKRGRGEWMTRATDMVEHRHLPIASDDEAQDDDPLLPLAKQAANFLRISRYGGWIITKHPAGDWRVGTVQKTSGELILMAERQGFDKAAAIVSLQADGGEAVS